MRSKYLFMCAFVVGVMALLAAPVEAQDPAPAGGCVIGKWTASVDYFGPVDCSAPNDPLNPGLLVENPDGLCTGVQYSVGGNKNTIAHAAVLAYNPGYLYPADGYVDAQVGPSGEPQAPCDGDEATNSGVGSCHEQAIRFNPNDVVDGPFWFVVEGLRQPSATTLTLKSNKTYRCEIKGVGDLVDENVLPDGCVPSCGDFDEDQSIIKTEIIDFKGCKARFEWNLTNGSVVDFGAPCGEIFIDPDDTDLLAACCVEYPDDPNCGGDCEFPEYYDLDVDLITVDLPDGTGVPLNFGDGLFSIGADSCSCRIIGGRVYCWGRPCPQ
jgi:hypothetical protein